MSNVASVLKEEISRVARKEIRRETSSLKKASTTHRSEIAALKRRVFELERQLRRVGRAGKSSPPAAANEDSVSPSARFSAKSNGLAAAPSGLVSSRMRPSQLAHRLRRSTTGKRARHAPARSTCLRSTRSGTWAAGKRTRFWKPARRPSSRARGRNPRRDFRS